MFVPEHFVVKVDDDNIPTDETGFIRFISIATSERAIVGRGGTQLDTPLCNLQVRIAPSSGHKDYASFLVLFDPFAGKIMHRFRWYTYLGAEDVALGVANTMECQTKSIQVPFKVAYHGDDGLTQEADHEIHEGSAKLPGWILTLQACHAVFAGYRPSRWRDVHVERPTEIRLPYWTDP
jgi:hypothetical protein